MSAVVGSQKGNEYGNTTEWLSLRASSASKGGQRNRLATFFVFWPLLEGDFAETENKLLSSANIYSYGEIMSSFRRPLLGEDLKDANDVFTIVTGSETCDDHRHRMEASWNLWYDICPPCNDQRVEHRHLREGR